jgi:hypothetical protein
VTTWVLGFVKFGDRAWAPEEINALEAIAACLHTSKPALRPKQSFATWLDTTI